MHIQAEQSEQETVSALSLIQKVCLPQPSTSHVPSVGSPESACEPEVKQNHFLS
jgi:hypothetical protein